MTGMLRITCGAALLTLALAAPAFADCSAVIKAFDDVQARPEGFRQTITMTPAGKAQTVMEMIELSDAAYLKTGKNWRKQPITAADRKEMMDKILATTPPTDCAIAGEETIDGVPTTVYTYKQADMTNPGSVKDVKLWVATSDGLPRKSESAATSIVFAYDNLVSPLP